jgi:hypothetical protein
MPMNIDNLRSRIAPTLLIAVAALLTLAWIGGLSPNYQFPTQINTPIRSPSTEHPEHTQAVG